MTRMPLRSAALLAALVALAACSGAPQATMRATAPETLGAYRQPVELVALTPETVAAYAAAPEAGEGGWRYRLGAEDTVQVYVVDAPEMTLPGGAEAGYRVEPDGAIQLPFLGRVPAEGLTPEALRDDIARRLRQYIAAPQVEVRVTGFNARHIAVVGAVQRPNRQPLTTTPLTVIDAINAAGGFAAGAERSHVVLIRGGQEQAVDLDGFLTRGAPTPVLQDGDVLRVGEGAHRAATPAAAAAPVPDVMTLVMPGARPRVFAAGQGRVTLAGLLSGQPPMEATIYVLRPGPDRLLALTVDARGALAPELGGRLALAAGDRILVTPGAVTDPAEHLSRITRALAAL